MATAPSSVPAARGPVAYGSYVDEVLGYRQTVGGVASVYYPHGNHLYSVAALTNAAGQVVERYSYTAYGKQTITGPTGVVRQVSAVGYNRGFTGYIADNETGLMYARARMYSPTLGRFISRDPMEYIDGLLLYAAMFVPNSLDWTGEAETSCSIPPDDQTDEEKEKEKQKKDDEKKVKDILDQYLDDQKKKSKDGAIKGLAKAIASLLASGGGPNVGPLLSGAFKGGSIAGAAVGMLQIELNSLAVGAMNRGDFDGAAAIQNFSSSISGYGTGGGGTGGRP